MPTDSHYQLGRCSRKKFVGAKGTSTGMRSYPFALGFNFNDVLIPLFIGQFYLFGDSGKLSAFFCAG